MTYDFFTCTKALAAKLPSVSQGTLADPTPLGDWHAHVYIIDRRQCVMFCHDSTRFVLFESGLKKDQFHDLGQLHKQLYLAALVSMGVSEARSQRVELALGPALFDTAADRSVLGTLNQSRGEFDYYLANYSNIMEVDVMQAAQWFNDRPLTARGKWLWPDKAMLELVGSL